MAFGIYVHIPFCIQKCSYCDFATLPQDTDAKYRDYVQLLAQEIALRSASIPKEPVTSLYFGGGTPSLLSADSILSIQKYIANAGFEYSRDFESTLEINPGTVNKEKLDLYRGAGIHRLSVGVQTFHAPTLKKLGREHSSDDTRKTLELIASENFPYTADLMFGLPNQTLESLTKDIELLMSYKPKHISLYNLTIPEKHHLNIERPEDEVQTKMFELIEETLFKYGIARYEISNFSQPGYESKHNLLYWTGASYWGIGLGAHSFMNHVSDFGARFWNPKSINKYSEQVASLKYNPFWLALPPAQLEILKQHESLTDYFHTRLRRTIGFTKADLITNYSLTEKLISEIEKRIQRLVNQNLMEVQAERYFLTPQGRHLANKVFFELTFLPEDLM
jgi:oxygen-independent coproporphyrinogen-3 oxidase